jgi:hypothetical protein
MNVGDSVILKSDWLPCKEGCQGIVKSIDSDGYLTVKITHNHDCEPFTFLIPFASPDIFELGSRCS